MNKLIRRESINPQNDKNQWHGYQEFYDAMDKFWYRGCYKNDEPIGYSERSAIFKAIGDEGTEVRFHIK